MGAIFAHFFFSALHFYSFTWACYLPERITTAIDVYDNSDDYDDGEDGMPVGSQTLLPYYYCKCPGCRLDDVVFITRPNNHHPITQYAAGWLAGCTRGLSGNKRNEANGGRLERESLAQELIFAISLTGTYGWGLLYCVS